MKSEQIGSTPHKDEDNSSLDFQKMDEEDEDDEESDDSGDENIKTALLQMEQDRLGS